jgi:hypothetical protein
MNSETERWLFRIFRKKLNHELDKLYEKSSLPDFTNMNIRKTI